MPLKLSVTPMRAAMRRRCSVDPMDWARQHGGVSGLYASYWHGLWRRRSKDIIVRLNSAVRSALADPMIRQRYTDQGQSIPPSDQQTPEALVRLQKAEIEKWWPIIKAAGIKAG